MKIAILINGSIRKFKTITEEVTVAFSNFESKIFISEYAGHFKLLCKQALDDGYKCFIFVGGDGSLNEGINGIINYFNLGCSTEPNDYNWQAISQIKVGVYAAGSGNDFIKSVNLDENISTLVANISKQSSKMIDVGWMSCQNFEDKKQVSFFINVTDVGMGGEVVLKKSKMPKWLSGKFTYFIAITSTVATYKKCHLIAHNNEFSWQGKVLNMVVANAKYFGNSLGIAPDADVSDGMFSLVIVGDVSLYQYFKNLGKLKKCKKITHQEVSYQKVKEITIEATNDRVVTIDMDGELIGKAPMTLKCLQQKINFIC